MDYNTLLDLATDLGYELAMSGAETFRVEDSINRVLETYGIASEAFAIPNCLTVSIETDDGIPMTRMRRIGFHGNDLEAVELFNALSRAICNRKPDPQEARQWLKQTRAACRKFTFPMYLLGHFLGAFGFSLFFGGRLTDGLWAGVCGMIIGLVNKLTNALKTNPFFSTIASAFISSLFAYSVASFGIVHNVDAVIIGTLMILVPGLLFTNSMRDIIYGDTNSGIIRIVQVLLIALAIALGTAAAWQLTASFWAHPAVAPVMDHPWLLQCCVVLIGSIGFAIQFNVHGMGIWLCALGGFLTWAVYLIAYSLGCDVIASNFWASLFAAAYSEIMARIRKYPAISYLVVSIFPLLPGAGIYYTMSHTIQGNMDLALQKGSETIGVAGIMAVGILLVSTIVRLLTTQKKSFHRK